MLFFFFPHSHYSSSLAIPTPTHLDHRSGHRRPPRPPPTSARQNCPSLIQMEESIDDSSLPQAALRRLLGDATNALLTALNLQLPSGRPPLRPPSSKGADHRW